MDIRLHRVDLSRVQVAVEPQPEKEKKTKKRSKPSHENVEYKKKLRRGK